MNRNSGEIFLYLLVDNSMLQERPAHCDDNQVKSLPIWLESIYKGRALEVSPLLIDVEAAYDSGDIGRVMHYLNARKPALHVSIIESEMRLEEIAQHLRRFVFILDPDERQLTLRFADCIVLELLCSLLTPVQWTTMTRPITRWGIHSRSGLVISLPLLASDTDALIPLRLDREQLAALDDASEPDHFIAKVKMMHHGAELPGNSEEQHVWAKEARREWQAAQNSNPLILLFLTEAMLFCRGEILQRQDVKGLLAVGQVNIFRERLKNIVERILENSKYSAKTDI